MAILDSLRTAHGDYVSVSTQQHHGYVVMHMSHMSARLTIRLDPESARELSSYLSDAADRTEHAEEYGDEAVPEPTF